ncbi:type II toxin-antitoxin system YafQ family toxin [Mycoplasma mycoides subsp. capri]|uniref:type II toxin-antitoxin system YafQ family toxin n=1 Tax=Mycoplasma mycoides TaxID=2102 RepID=UPI00223F1C9B|nr:type II toxin-antitoxin system YafQ family toxin [Mycoplasma mycoides]QVJ96182.1 type II toxin-antitoxin system YafQ family toxin [Mycoplasma mycoides subsp. capri]QVJ97076.1 type II toxin-antitoxin system YafQ family toxin [Mycoplasma mycoides subsp. capri]QVK00058.1 type II toxin-antitoxin system YafQ family toxin [Mycoplasma mycoides subsp. capri]QVK00940.1 type II toxin-antitoxin system YafQ family toxin [Mycoplasma mycoides subsp. capri]
MIKYTILTTTKFIKDLKLAKKQNKNLEKLDIIINKLENDEILDKKYKDHPLTGKYEGYRECHIEPDWLLIYKKEKKDLLLVLFRLGSHSKIL